MLDHSGYLTLLGLQSHFGGKLLEIKAVCPQCGTALLKRVDVRRCLDAPSL